MIHEMKLKPKPFSQIKNQLKKVELRLNDEKRQRIHIGDFIEFTNIVTNEKIIVQVTKLCKFPNFDILYNHYQDKTILGYLPNEIPNPNDMLSYYTKDEILKNGVLGIEFILSNNSNII